jgi:hypothetical protein
MKRLFVLAAAALSLTLFSFVAPENGGNKYGQGTNGITRIGVHDFTQTTAARFTADEQAVFDKLTQERYHIKNVRLAAGSSIDLESAERGIWVYRNEIWTQDRFKTKTFVGSDAILAADPTLQQAEAILARYADAK